MKKIILTLAAALTLGGAVAATPAAAQDRTVVRTTRTVVMHRHQDWRRDGDRDRRYHRGWRNHHRTCRVMWRHHQRIRTCRSW